MTSAGGHSVIPNYGAVSAAKAVMESHIRQLAYRTDAPWHYRQRHSGRDHHYAGSSKIPGIEKLAEFARLRNPGGRLTTPEDVARPLPP